MLLLLLLPWRTELLMRVRMTCAQDASVELIVSRLSQLRTLELVQNPARAATLLPRLASLPLLQLQRLIMADCGWPAATTLAQLRRLPQLRSVEIDGDEVFDFVRAT
jgi:hypothetical protein